MKPDASEPQSLNEIATNAAENPDLWELRLYVAGKTAKSIAASPTSRGYVSNTCEASSGSKWWIC